MNIYSADFVKAIIVNLTSSGSRFINSLIILHASLRIVSGELGPWFIGKLLRPSNSYKWPST